MDKDRMKGMAHQAKGAVKQKAGKAMGDKKNTGRGQGREGGGEGAEYPRRREGQPARQIAEYIILTSPGDPLGLFSVGLFRSSPNRGTYLHPLS